MTPWLTKAGTYTIEKIPCPDYAGNVDMSAPPKGVLHTTEGGWDGSLAVFKQHYAPHFMVGEGRIAQLLPLGHAAAALEHPANIPATNGIVRAQIELVGHSLSSSWLPDHATLDALTSLLATLAAAAGIPLRHVAPARDEKAFAAASGWMGHIDIPGNSHWDPGALKWAAVMTQAQAKIPVVKRAPAVKPPARPKFKLTIYRKSGEVIAVESTTPADRLHEALAAGAERVIVEPAA